VWLTLFRSRSYAKGLKGQYQWLAEKAGNLANAKWFVNFVTLVIVTAGVMVGLQTYAEYADDPVLNVIDIAILAIFTFECLVKFVAEEFQPWKFFNSAWNSFDFVVVAGSFLPAAGSLVTMLRLLRLLRVLKLVKSLPALAVIVNALIMGLSSIGFIGVILGLCFYLFAILGMILFKANDPWHFGSLHTSILTLFRCATGEDWTDVMYINVYGCGKVPWTDQYGGAWNENITKADGDDDDFYVIIDREDKKWYTDMDQASDTFGQEFPCQYADYPGKSAVAAFYFIFFMLLGSLVLLTLFIGVICTAMDEAQQAQKEEEELEERIAIFAEKNELTEFSVESYRKVFLMLDIDQGGSIEEDELRTGLTSVGQDPSEEEMARIMKEVDEDESGEIDLAEFVEFMHKMKEELANGGAKTPAKVTNSPHEHTPVQEISAGGISGLDEVSEIDLGAGAEENDDVVPKIGNWGSFAGHKYKDKGGE